jgi:hypothetical protein
VYLAEICSCALKSTTKVWTRQWLLVAFASPVLTVPIRGLFSGSWQMNDLVITACITVLVVAALWVATFLFNLAFAPAELDRKRLQRIHELESRFASAEQRRAVTTRLAIAMGEGQRISKLGQEGMGAAKQWAAATHDLISDLFGPGEGELFSNDAGLPVAISTFTGELWMQRRLTRLHDLLSKADGLLRDNPVGLESLQLSGDLHVPKR